MWRKIYEAILWLVVGAGICAALWPASESVYGWWNQRQLRLAWEAEVKAAHSSPRQGIEQTEDTASYETESSDGAEESGTVDDSSKGSQHNRYASGAASDSNSVRLVRASTSRGSQRTKSIRENSARVRRRKSLQRKGARKRWLPMRLTIDSIGLDAIVVHGVTKSALKRGPGFDPSSTLPGQPGNCVIAGHRNAYGWWFYKLNSLGNNSLIQLATPDTTYTYKVASTLVVPETATHLLRPPRNPHAAPRLTLYTCALPHGDNRIVVIANLIERRSS